MIAKLKREKEEREAREAAVKAKEVDPKRAELERQFLGIQNIDQEEK